MSAYVPPSSCLGRWIRTDLGVRTDVAFQDAVHRPVLLETFRLRLSIVFSHLCSCLVSVLGSFLLPLFLRGGGGGVLVPFSVPFVPVSFVAVAGAPIFAIFCGWCLMTNSTFGTQTLLAMRKFLDEAELRSHQEVSCSQRTKEATNEGNAECKGEDPAECKKGGSNRRWTFAE